ncbi:hypothetical protein FB565_004738 [Actinoplanes lutulentus]|uniref:Uncharacterized protein n=1 Tax=Actinoplanes lutulentus TaxID=1287878 RepID=A0A327Z5N3_9ACTN|nr:hypothetical protein [Actinoplanes lutulentus]MBB2945005.1 hypothetical protein [Actinoplanes lutulentus]RAK31799.1 hypothetical protein B0I29_11447 [Actinoplanes lutulentus]
MRIDELLEEAKADAPPARLAVDDLVNAGRRRLRRRNTGWALAAVLAVAATVGVPQILARPSAQMPAQVPVAPSPTKSPPKAEKFSLVAPFRGYTVDGFTVADPDAMSLSWTSAMIRQAGTDPDDQDGILSVTPPGVNPEPEGEFTTFTTDPVDGRDAYFLRQSGGGESLLWKLADGGFARVGSTATMSRSDMRRIAEAFKTGGGKPIRTALSSTYIPDGYRIYVASGLRARFITAAKAEEILTNPGKEAPDLGGNTISIKLEQANGGFSNAKDRCSEDEPECKVRVGGYVLVVSGDGVKPAERQKIFESVRPANPEDPSTWTPADEAYPTFVRPEVS